MLEKKNILKILKKAAVIDEYLELFGSSTHGYKLNPVISSEFICTIENKYSFTLPEDYFHFITEIGDGGACVDYGLTPFSEFMQRASSPDAERFREAYRKSLSEPFCPRKMQPNEIEHFAFTKESYEKSPKNFFCIRIFGGR